MDEASNAVKKTVEEIASAQKASMKRFHKFTVKELRREYNIMRKLDRKTTQSIIDPRVSKPNRVWVIFRSIIILVCSIWTPFQVAVIDSFYTRTCGESTWATSIDLVIDVIFLIDMVLQFNTMAEVSHRKNMHGINFKYWTTSRVEIAVHYFQTWWVFDAAATSAFVVSMIPRTCQVGVNGTYQGYGYKLLRMFRCLKRSSWVTQVLKDSAVMGSIAERLGLTSATNKMWEISSGVLLVTHLLACMLLLQVHVPWLRGGPSIMDTWLGRFGYCWISEGFGPRPFGVPGGIECANGGFLYLRSYNWAILLVTGYDFVPSEGPSDPYCPGNTWHHGNMYGDFWTQGRHGPARVCRPELNDAEVNVITVVIVVCALLWTLVTAKFVDLVVIDDREQGEFLSRMDELDRFCSRNGISTLDESRVKRSLRFRLKEYVKASRHLWSTSSRDEILSNLSPELQLEVALSLNGHWFAQVPFFANAPNAFLVRVTFALQAHVYPPLETIRSEGIYIIDSGIAFQSCGLLHKGCFFGLESLLQSDWLPRLKTRTMSYLDCFFLSSEALRGLAAQYPQVGKDLRRWVAFRALANFLIANLQEERHQRRVKEDHERWKKQQLLARTVRARCCHALATPSPLPQLALAAPQLICAPRAFSWPLQGQKTKTFQARKQCSSSKLWEMITMPQTRRGRLSGFSSGEEDFRKSMALEREAKLEREDRIKCVLMSSPRYSQMSLGAPEGAPEGAARLSANFYAESERSTDDRASKIEAVRRSFGTGVHHRGVAPCARADEGAAAGFAPLPAPSAAPAAEAPAAETPSAKEVRAKLEGEYFGRLNSDGGTMLPPGGVGHVAASALTSHSDAAPLVRELTQELLALKQMVSLVLTNQATDQRSHAPKPYTSCAAARTAAEHTPSILPSILPGSTAYANRPPDALGDGGRAAIARARGGLHARKMPAAPPSHTHAALHRVEQQQQQVAYGQPYGQPAALFYGTRNHADDAFPDAGESSSPVTTRAGGGYAAQSGYAAQRSWIADEERRERLECSHSAAPSSGGSHSAAPTPTIASAAPGELDLPDSARAPKSSGAQQSFQAKIPGMPMLPPGSAGSGAYAPRWGQGRRASDAMTPIVPPLTPGLSDRAVPILPDDRVSDGSAASSAAASPRAASPVGSTAASDVESVPESFTSDANVLRI